MRIVIVADGRSPITRRWIQAVLSLDHEVILVSTYPCAPVEGVSADVCLPVAFAGLAGSAAGEMAGPPSTRQARLRSLVSRARPALLPLRYGLGPLTLPYYGRRLRWLVERMKPDLVHALRIPFEGMLAAWSPPGIPLAVSIWGNDLTLHAAGSGRMAALTRHTLERARGLATDTERDVRLAATWGFGAAVRGKPIKLNRGIGWNPNAALNTLVTRTYEPGSNRAYRAGMPKRARDKMAAAVGPVEREDTATLPILVAPGSGGLDLAEMARVQARALDGGRFADLFAPGAPLVVNPRGFRTGSVRNDTFFSAIPLVLERCPEVRFACAAMAGQREALSWLDRLKLHDRVILLPHLPQTHLWELLSGAQVSVSVSRHDGTPNSLLEAMALGVFPVAGDIESIREWIVPGVNGLLVEPGSPVQLAEAILLALDDDRLHRRAASENSRLVRERAEASIVREKLRHFYEQVVTL